MSAADRGWGPGWPDCQRDKIVDLTVGTVQFPGGVRREVKQIFADFLLEFHMTVEKLVPGWCWGFECRAIRDSDRPSNHSWGLAVDINAPRHPMGKEGTFSSQQAQRIRVLCDRYGMRWGGDYSGRKDEMHVEYMGTRQQALAFNKEQTVARSKPAEWAREAVEWARAEDIFREEHEDPDLDAVVTDERLAVFLHRAYKQGLLSGGDEGLSVSQVHAIIKGTNLNPPS